MMKKHSILIVDDEENVSRLLNKILSKEGYSTFCAADGFEAIDIVDRNEIEVIISDIRMPNMDGIELIRRVKEIESSIKFIMITAFATVETAVEALRRGASDYIIKPFNLEDVLASVKKLFTKVEDECDNDGSGYRKTLLDNYLVTKSPAMIEVMELVKKISDTKSTVMIYGETGTGKELTAKALHSLSSRRDMPFIKVNCAAIPDTLLESELFGYEKGAFTGALTQKPGRFELAHGGTIFLDEIGDISPATQVKLLRILQEREFEHLGGTKTVRVDVRVIAATNRKLEELVEEGKFRQDLYYRLNVVPVNIPPLRDRKEDIPLLVEYFLNKASTISGKNQKRITKAVMEKLTNYNWPGNIRELENIMERCVVVTERDIIDVADLPKTILCSSKTEGIEGHSNLDEAVDNAESNAIIKALKESGGNRTKAAEALGISRRSLHRKISKYGINSLQ